MRYDLIIRRGQVVDGTGRLAYEADLGIKGDRIVRIGDIQETGDQEIDASGALVTPGFVDIHTHLDAQVGWDKMLSSCCWHGVTSVVMGNCGVSFAPVRKTDKVFLAEMMEAVEDIPADGILSALPWTWETYGEYLDQLEQFPKGLNIGGMVGHCAVRVFAMGDRALQQEPASKEDVAAMVEIVSEAIEAGALGFSTSRSFMHRVPDGRPVPGTYADEVELFAIANVLGEHGVGVFQSAPGLPVKGTDTSLARDEIRVLGDISRRTGRPVSFSLVASSKRAGFYRDVLSWVSEEVSAGALIRPQSTTRPIGMLYGLALRMPWDSEPGWLSVQNMDVEDRLAFISKPENQQLLVQASMGIAPEELFVLAPDSLDYRPRAENSLAHEARRRNVQPLQAFIELNLETEGRVCLTHPILNDEWEAVEYMLSDPNTVLGLADAGAHVGMVMDASQPTWTLSHLARDTGFYTIEEAVRKMTSDTADLFGIVDRGRLVEGSYADINVIDLEELAMKPPEMVRDMPEGAQRIIQGARGYRHTIINGQEFMRFGESTDKFPGRVLRNGAHLR